MVMPREGDFDPYLAQALGNRCDLSACFGTVYTSSARAGYRRVDWAVNHLLGLSDREVRHDRYERSRRVKEFPMIIKMNEPSMMEIYVLKSIEY